MTAAFQHRLDLHFLFHVLRSYFT